MKKFFTFFAPLLILAIIDCTSVEQKEISYSYGATTPVRHRTMPPPAPVPVPVHIQPEPPIKTFSQSVGVILPLSGPFKVYGDRTLTAMRLAIDVTATELVNNALVLKGKNNFSLVVMDSGGQAGLATQAVDRLASEFNVGVIVGDILGDTALAVAKRAEERGVIDISLSRKDQVTQVGPSAFRMGVTARKQMAALLTPRTDQKELKRFAVLYPQNGYGTEMRDAFVSEVKKRGGTVVKIEGYKPDETTFTASVRRLVGARRTVGNPAYEECIAKANRLSDASARRKNANDCLDGVAPNIGFDAIFIPEFPKTLSYIIPALISEGIMVSQNEGMLKAYRRTSHNSDAQAVQLLGPDSWNNASIGEKLGTQIDGALFVYAGDLDQTSPETKQFVDRFKGISGSEPSKVEALAYDAVRLLQTLNLEALSHDLSTLAYLGVSGKISFDNERESVIPFRWFAFSDGKILGK